MNKARFMNFEVSIHTFNYLTNSLASFNKTLRLDDVLKLPSDQKSFSVRCSHGDHLQWETPGLVFVQKFLRYFSDGWFYFKFKHFLSLWQSVLSGSNMKTSKNIYLRFSSNQLKWSRGATKKLVTSKVCLGTKIFLSRFKIDSFLWFITKWEPNDE